LISSPNVEPVEGSSPRSSPVLTRTSSYSSPQDPLRVRFATWESPTIRGKELVDARGTYREARRCRLDRPIPRSSRRSHRTSDPEGGPRHTIAISQLDSSHQIPAQGRRRTTYSPLHVPRPIVAHIRALHRDRLIHPACLPKTLQLSCNNQLCRRNRPVRWPCTSSRRKEC
jgi:hypothetical protein